MPELPEVETVKESLKKLVLNKKIVDVVVRYPNIVSESTVEDFINNLKNQTICNIKRRGKWLMFELNDYYLLSHLRMEGKYLIREENMPYEKHEHVIFIFSDKTELRYKDTRKFGRMILVSKKDIGNCDVLKKVGMEPFDSNLTQAYLLAKYKMKKIPIKTALLDQSIIAGIGNIYADEILFLSHINPLKPCNEITENEAKQIIKNTSDVLKKAILKGGTTIRSYESSEGVHGNFQGDLLVHNKEGEECVNCKGKIVKITVNTRGTYYCPNCQK